ncbi:protein flp-like [Pecten maximus]|uniref:protein flp-like n=1 Tax=Pecten maximus TaxID=6579 RepID=UPI0014582445|nr:protein flp-like [Pecten maximus]
MATPSWFGLLHLVVYVTCATAAITDFETQVDHVIQQAHGCRHNNPGLAVAVVKNGKVILAKGYGVRDVSTGTPTTNTTVFGIASLSKAFAATLLMKQLGPNNLTIYSTVADILGDHFQFSTNIRTQNADLRDLLAHTLGIPGNNYIRLDTNLTLQNLPSRIKNLKSIHPFRSSFMYNNLMYGLVTEISEKLGHKTWQQLINTNIFTPLGMTGSTFMTTVNRKNTDVAQGYVDDFDTGAIVPVPEELNRFWGKLAGSGGVMSNAVDMTKWMMFHLNGGKNSAGHQVVDAHALASIYVPRNSIRSSTVGRYFTKPDVPVTTSENNYAFGWKNGFYRGYPILRHTGTTFGYSSLLTLIPDMDIGVFITMTGSDHDYLFRTVLENYLADNALGETPWLNATTMCTFPEPWMRKHVTTHHSIVKNLPLHRPVSSYVGTYHNEAYGNLYVHNHAGDQSQLNMQVGIGNWKLFPTHTTDHFDGEGEGTLYKIKDLRNVQFHLDSHSSGIHSIEVPSFESHAPPLFTKTTSDLPGLLIG